MNIPPTMDTTQEFVNQAFIRFKQEVQQQILLLDFTEKNKQNQLFQFINEYEKPVLPAKKTAPALADELRCIAINSNRKRCARKRKAGCSFCDTHIVRGESELKTLEIEIVEVSGIPYFVDKYGNVYKHEAITEKNPPIIGKYVAGNIVIAAGTGGAALQQSPEATLS